MVLFAYRRWGSTGAIGHILAANGTAIIYLNRPLDDHVERPLELIVFEDTLAEANFLGLAHKEMRCARINLPLWVSSREALEKSGPLDNAWRSPDVLEPAGIFR